MRSGDSYLQTLRDANLATDNWSSAADDERIFSGAISPEAYQAHLRGEYVDWADELLETAMTQNYSLSLSGGTEKTKAYFSLNFSDENGQYRTDSYKVYSTNIRVDHQVSNWFKAGINLQASYTHQNRAYADLSTALTAIPLGRAYDDEGNVVPNPIIGDSSVANLLLNDNKNAYRNQGQNLRLYVNPYVELTPIKGLSIISRLGGALTYSRGNVFVGEGSYQYYSSAEQTRDSQKFARITDRRNYNYRWENIITYNFTPASDHDITVTGVTTWNHNQNDRLETRNNDIVSNNYLWYNIQNTTSSQTSTEYEMSKGFGLIGRLNYSYKGRYLFSASVRHDGSSRLSKDNRWDTFPSLSAGWRISDEAFMESTKSWLDNLKLRVGYGVTGTAGIDPYQSVSYLESANAILGGALVNTTNYSQSFTNRRLGWEKSYNTNFGLDVAFLNGRIDLTTDYYWTKTRGVIWTRDISSINGMYNANTPYNTAMNICETMNRGIEFALNTRNIVTKDFTWNSTLTFAYNKEKITALDAPDREWIRNSGTDFILYKGEAVNSYYHYKLAGIWQLGEEADAAVFGKNPGDIKVDVPGMHKESDGVYYKINEETGERTYYNAENRYAYSDADYQVLGHNSPDYTIGFQNTFTWKDFDLSVYLYARMGQTFRYGFLQSYDPTGVRNFPEYFNYWTENNPSNDFPAINANATSTTYPELYAMQYVDGSFFKVKNITLGYTLPKKWLNKAGLSKCRFYATITNPLVMAKSNLLKDYDPEMNGELNYPLTKQLVFGVNLSF